MTKLRVVKPEIVVRTLTYDKKGPSIKGGPHGWERRKHREADV